MHMPLDPPPITSITQAVPARVQKFAPVAWEELLWGSVNSLICFPLSLDSGRDTVGVHKIFPVLDDEIDSGLPRGWCGSLEGLAMEFDVRPSVRKGNSSTTSAQDRLSKGQQVCCDPFCPVFFGFMSVRVSKFPSCCLCFAK